ncbi:MAG: LacI family DNA-binding transcriptional regulator [Verrucomicrobiota bacterium]
MAKVSQSDIAREARVSRNTVSLALRNSPRLPADTRERIQKIAREMGYQPDPALSRAMAALVASRGEARETLALVYARSQAELFRWPAFSLIRQGFLDRAAELGFGVDEFDTAGDSALTKKRLWKILRSRSIRGVGLLGHWATELSPDWQGLWENFALVSASGIIHQPAISHACADFFHAGYLALERVVQLGYRRPALIMQQGFDRRQDYQLSHGYLAAGWKYFDRHSVPLLMGEEDIGERDLQAFLEKQAPDCVITLPRETWQWLENLGVKPGRDLGLVGLDYRHEEPRFAGVDLVNQLSGTACVDLIAGQLSRNEIGLPFMHKTVTSHPVFRDGPSLPPRDELRQ